MRKLWPCGFLAATVLLTLVCYWNGLNGPFLFDDPPNLEALGQLGGVTDWITLKAYVFTGWSGPTGRPLSLLSFLLNDNSWPSQPYSFKLTNLQLHLVCGLLLTWATYLLLRAARLREHQAAALAVLSASVWMLHPYMLSTTLYVVQRMTVLCTLFMLAGMVAYLKGRLWLDDPTRTRLQAYMLMTLGLGLGTVLAVLSKENGALLPLLVLVLEGFLYRKAGPGPDRVWIGAFLVLPSFAILGYLLKMLDFSANPWPTRPFNQVERLYSEARIVWEYLRELWVPRVEGSGLYQDGFDISHGLTQPMATLWAVAGWIALFGALPWLYRRLPFVWLAIVFFLCGHLVESTVVGLELHFEHRNYAPSVFMFLPLAVGIGWLQWRVGAGIAAIAVAGLLTVTGLLTWQRSQLWSSDQRLQTYWALNSPQSARGKNYLIGRLVEEHKYAEALALADRSMGELPRSPLLTMTWLRIHVNTQQATPQHFKLAAERLVTQPFDAQTVTGLRILTDDVVYGAHLTDYRQPMLGLLQQMSVEGPYKTFPLFMRLIPYLEAQVHLSLNDPDKAYANYRTAMELYGQASAGMQMFAEMARSGHTRQATQLLTDLELGINKGSYAVAPLNQAYYRSEIDRMRHLLTESSLPPKEQ